MQENKIDFSFLSTFIMPVQMNVGHILARSIFMQPTLKKARELLHSSRGSCNFFSYGFLLSLFSLKSVCITLPARCQLQGVLMKGAFPRLSEGMLCCHAQHPEAVPMIQELPEWRKVCMSSGSCRPGPEWQGGLRRTWL